MIDRKRQDELAHYCRLIHSSGWVANHDGNLSVRDDDGRFVATPTSWSKRLVEVEDLLVVDRTGKVLRGRHRLFGEWQLHRAVYDARPDARAVIHAHPPVSTGFALAGVTLGRPVTAELLVSLGPEIPTVPFTAPGSEELERAVGSYAEWADVMLLDHHGVLSLGNDLEQAFLRLELVEHYARQVLVARQLGGERGLPEAVHAPLLAARTRAGLGPEARGQHRD
ncbi:MAG: class II aldolase/adducin family protein [Pseudomonadota bacterium]